MLKNNNLQKGTPIIKNTNNPVTIYLFYKYLMLTFLEITKNVHIIVPIGENS